MSKLPAQLRHFLVETGDLLEHNQWFPRCHNNHYSPRYTLPQQFTKLFQPLLFTATPRKRQGRGSLCRDENTQMLSRIWNSGYSNNRPSP